MNVSHLLCPCAWYCDLLWYFYVVWQWISIAQMCDCLSSLFTFCYVAKECFVVSLSLSLSFFCYPCILHSQTLGRSAFHFGFHVIILRAKPDDTFAVSNEEPAKNRSYLCICKWSCCQWNGFHIRSATSCFYLSANIKTNENVVNLRPKRNATKGTQLIYISSWFLCNFLFHSFFCSLTNMNFILPPLVYSLLMLPSFYHFCLLLLILYSLFTLC